jgi:hypothetical protein
MRVEFVPLRERSDQCGEPWTRSADQPGAQWERDARHPANTSTRAECNPHGLCGAVTLHTRPETSVAIWVRAPSIIACYGGRPMDRLRDTLLDNEKGVRLKFV